ncbi:hypothetical protein DFQ27_003475, partial [Actinomortierella ambigua]
KDATSTNQSPDSMHRGVRDQITISCYDDIARPTILRDTEIGFSRAQDDLNLLLP